MRPLTCSADAPNMHRQPAAQAAGMPSSNKARMLFPSAPASSCADKKPLPRPYSIVNKRCTPAPQRTGPAKAAALPQLQGPHTRRRTALLQMAWQKSKRARTSIAENSSASPAAKHHRPPAGCPLPPCPAKRPPPAGSNPGWHAACGGAAVPVAVRRHPVLLLRRSGAPEPIASGYRTLPGAAAEVP